MRIPHHVPGIALVAAALTGCASNWPQDDYILANAEREAAIPPPREAPNPPLPTERSEPYTGGPAFRRESEAQRQERLTALRLAELQRSESAQRPRASVHEMPDLRESRWRETELETVEAPIRTYPGGVYAEAEVQSLESHREYESPDPNTPLPYAGADTAIPPMPQARPGECYALVRRPARYRTVRRQIVKRPAYEKYEVVPARYARSTETVVVQDEYERLEIIPATFRTVTERVMVREPTIRYVATEPVYETVTERVLVQPARQVWKPGRGAIERIDHATGEIMCLVEEPPVYKTVTRRVLKRPPEVREVEVPAEYRTITRRVVDRPAQIRRVRVPARTQTITVERVAEPAAVRKVTVPPEYDYVEVREMVEPARLEWRSILCQTNMTPETIRALQRALKARGFDPGPIDGVLGRRTMAAVNAYQRANGLPEDRYLNIETLRHLGVVPR